MTNQATAADDSEASSPVMAVADLDGQGNATTLLIDTSRPAGQRVIDVVTTDQNGNLIEQGVSSTAASAGDTVAGAGNLNQTTTLPFGNGGTIVAQSGQ